MFNTNNPYFPQISIHMNGILGLATMIYKRTQSKHNNY